MPVDRPIIDRAPATVLAGRAIGFAVGTVVVFASWQAALIVGAARALPARARLTALNYTRQLADAAVRDPERALRLASDVPKSTGYGIVERAYVVAESAPGAIAFLRKARYEFHSDPTLHGTALDPSHDQDKAAYDALNRVRTAVAEGRPGPDAEEQGGAWVATAAILDGTAFHGAAVVRVRAPALPPRLSGFSWFALVLCLALGAAASPIGGRAGSLLRGVLVLGAAVFGARQALQIAVEPPFPSVQIELGIVGSALPWLVYTAGAVEPVRRRLAALRRHKVAYGYIAPAAVGLLVLVGIPFAFGLGIAFFRYTPTEQTFVGLANLADIVSAREFAFPDPRNFYYQLLITALWTAANVALHLAIGLFLALVLQDARLRFRGPYRVLLILPWAVPNYITALIWKGMFNAEFGLVNALLGAPGFSWFNAAPTAFLANLVTNVWLGFPFMMVVSLGALQSIPRELYEAAEVDGASRWTSFRRVTLPLLKPALVPAVILGTVWTFNMFNVIYLVSGGGPDGATDILITSAFRFAFEQYRYGYAAAWSAVVFAILLCYSLITNRITRAAEGAFA